jgi:hypothetical protein
MKITDRQDTEIRRAVRDAMAIDPLISQRKMIEAVEKKLGRTVSFGYLQKLIKKVDREVAKSVDLVKVSSRLREMRETFRLSRENLIQTAYGYAPVGMAKPTHTERISAWRTIGLLEKILLDAEMDLGLFERNIGTVKVEHQIVDGSREQQMIKAIESWTLNPPQPRKIEVMDAVVVESSKVSGDIQNNTPEERNSPFTPKPLPTNQGPVIPGRDGSATIIPAKVFQPRVHANADGSVTVTQQ